MNREVFHPMILEYLKKHNINSVEELYEAKEKEMQHRRRKKTKTIAPAKDPDPEQSPR